MSEHEEVKVIYISEELRRASLLSADSDQDLTALPAPTKASSHKAHGHMHLPLGLRRSFASTDLLHHPHTASSLSSCSLDRLEAALHPYPDSSDWRHPLGVMRCVKLYPQISRSSHSSLEDALLPAAGGDVQEAKVLSETPGVEEKWSDAVDHVVQARSEDENAESSQSSEEEEGEEADRKQDGLKEAQSDSSLESENTLHTPYCASSDSTPRTRAPTAATSLSSDLDISLVCHPPSSPGCCTHHRCLAHCAITRHVCTATQTGHCCYRRVPGPYGSVPSCAQNRKELTAVVNALRVEVEQLRLSQEDNHRNIQSEMRALAAQWQRDREESQGSHSISTQLDSIQCEMRSITQLTLQSFYEVGRQLEELGAVLAQSPPNASSGK